MTPPLLFRAPFFAAPLLLSACLGGAPPEDLFDRPIARNDTTVVGVRHFATVPDSDGRPARMMLLVDEPTTGRLFVNDMRGRLHAVGYDGGEAVPYLELEDPRWGRSVQSGGRERGFQSFAFHPDFGRPGRPGHGLFYTWGDTDQTAAEPDFTTPRSGVSHHTVLLEWQAVDPHADRYDGGPPRELLRLAQPYGNHNAGHLAFHPGAEPGDPAYGLLWIGVADGGSGGDPMDLARDPASAFGKILRIDPLGRGAGKGAYGIPPDNPHVGRDGTLGEIWASGVRNPQRYGWDPGTGAMYVADIGQDAVEEVSPAHAGADLGWNEWEGSFRYRNGGGVSAADPRSDATVVYPVAEWSHGDPLIPGATAVTGVVVVRHDRVPALRHRVLFGDGPGGEIFHFDADSPPDGGNQGFGRLLLRSADGAEPFLQVMRRAAREAGRDEPRRADLRFGQGPDGRIFLLNKHDGIIRELVP